MPLTNDRHAVIIGAGPAGLTAAYVLGKAGITATVLEKDGVVGGISRTVRRDGYHFDIGGHRFFTKVEAVEAFWREVLPDEDYLECRRLSRIYYKKRFFHYPLRTGNALQGLGLWTSLRVVLSYLWIQFFPQQPEETFEAWVSNRFGRHLYHIFFKTYTEKVWGIPCDEITADWAAQRIKGLSLMQALKQALQPQQSTDKKAVIKTLIDTFHYPRLGPGMMWETVTEKVHGQGSAVRLHAEVRRIRWSERRVTGVKVQIDGTGQVVRGSHYMSSMPLRELVLRLDPPAPEPVRQAARQLRYRDFLTVALIVDQAEVFPDNWIYIHDPTVRVGRVQNFKNWSPDMVPDAGKTCLGLEYFCFEGDELWTMPDEALIALATREMDQLELVKAAAVQGGYVVRMPKAYPVYDASYKEALLVIRAFLDHFENLQVVGRNGMHRYNNQDHSMLTAMLAARNILGAEYDLWAVNDDDQYHEEIHSNEEASAFARIAETQPMVPERVPTSSERL